MDYSELRNRKACLEAWISGQQTQRRLRLAGPGPTTLPGWHNLLSRADVPHSRPPDFFDENYDFRIKPQYPYLWVRLAEGGGCAATWSYERPDTRPGWHPIYGVTPDDGPKPIPYNCDPEDVS